MADLLADVHVFARIGAVIVKHAGKGTLITARILGKAMRVRADGVAIGEASDGLRLPRRRGIAEQRHEAAALHVSGHRHTGKLAERGIHVDQLGERLGFLAAIKAGRTNHERHTHGGLVATVFAPQRVLRKVPAVIAPEDDDGVFREIEPLQLIEHAADLRIGEAHAGVVAAQHLQRHRIRQRAGFWHTCVGAELAGVVDGNLRCVFGRVVVRGELQTAFGIEIPIFLGADEGQVRLEETGGDEKRLTAFLHAAEVGDGLQGHLAVAVLVIAEIGDAKRASA